MNSKSAHSFESKKRSEDVKTQEEITFAEMHISPKVLEGHLLFSVIKILIC